MMPEEKEVLFAMVIPSGGHALRLHALSALRAMPITPLKLRSASHCSTSDPAQYSGAPVMVHRGAVTPCALPALPPRMPRQFVPPER